MLKGRSWAWEGRAILWKQRGGGGLRAPRAFHGSEWDIDRNCQLINSNTKLALKQCPKD